MTTSSFLMGELDSLKGLELGSTDWRVIDQDQITGFADLTGDKQWIHVDVERATAEGPFGGTIAHGYMTLGLLGSIQSLFQVTDATFGVNYGLDRVRFPAPVPEGSRVRLTATVADVTEVPGGWQVAVSAQIEIDGSPKPACVADALFRYFA